MRIFPQDTRITKVQYDIDYWENIRFNDTILFWKFYNGQHWNYSREMGEPQNTINYCKAIVDIGIDFLMGKSFTIDSRYDENKEKLVPLLEEVWEDNERDLLAMELALIGGVTGDAWIEVAYDSDLGRVVIKTLDSSMVFPTFNPHDKDEMVQVTIRYPAWKKTSVSEVSPDLFQNPVRHSTSDMTMYTYQKVYTPQRIREYHDDELVNDIPNPIGLIPIAHVKNLPSTGSYGYSDLKDIIALNREFNEKITDASDIINYHAAPTTVIYGARANSLEKGARKIWSGLPKDSRVENLELNTDLPAINTYLDNMKMAIHEMSSIPSHSFGETQFVSNTSGVALQMMYHPIVRKTNKKRISYSKGIREANVIIIKFLDVFGILAQREIDLKELENPYDTVISYPEMLPKDEMLAQQMDIVDLQNGLTSKAEILRKRGIPEEQVQKILAEAEEDQKKTMEMQMGSQYDMNNPQPGQKMPLDNTETTHAGGALQYEVRQNEQSDGSGRPKKANLEG